MKSSSKGASEKRRLTEYVTNTVLDFICCQNHSDDQLVQVLQTYQAYQESQSESQTPTRQLNTHITYHVAQATQAKIGSLVDMGANCGLAGFDVRVLSTSPRKSTVGYSV